jgi:AcrR family transcriptional regulator
VRADAQRNRARVLEVAAQVFLERGTDTSTEEIARAAGVGVGTVFRHFPTKAALVEAVYHDMLARMAADITVLSTREDGLFEAFMLLAEHTTTKRTYTDALTAMNVEVFTEGSYVLRDLMVDLLRRAKQAGTVRADIELGDLLALLIGASGALQQVGPDPAARSRVLTVIVDGMRP